MNLTPLTAFLQIVAWPFARILFFKRFGFKVVGREHIQNLPKGVLFAATHTSHFDPIAIRAAMPWLSRHGPLFFVAREKKVYGWKGWKAYVYGDWFFHSWGAFPAYKGLQDYASSLRHFLELGKKRRSIAIFPRGIEHRNKPQPPVHGGVGFLAHSLDYLVVPVYISKLYQTPALDSEEKRQTYLVKFGQPVSPKEYIPSEPTLDDFKKFAELVMERVDALEKETMQ